MNLVQEIITSSAKSHSEVIHKDKIEVQLIDFGSSSVDFRLYFYADNIFRIERVKSDIRKIIFEQFRIKAVEIPFPQMDVHMKN